MNISEILYALVQEEKLYVKLENAGVEGPLMKSQKYNLAVSSDAFYKRTKSYCFFEIYLDREGDFIKGYHVINYKGERHSFLHLIKGEDVINICYHFFG